MTRLASLMLIVLMALAGLAWPASASGPLCGTSGELQPLGYQQIVVSTTAVGFTVPTNALFAVVIVGTNAINMRDDGTNPTSSVGMPYGVSSLPQSFTICGGRALAAARLIRQSSDSTVNISYYGP